MSETDRDKAVLRKYYAESEFLLSPEGILKVISVVVSVISGSLWLSSPCPAGRYAGAAGAGAAGAGAALVGALAVIGAEVVRVTTRAPYFWFYMDMVVSCASGVVLLLAATFSFTVCQLSAPIHYVYGPLSLLAAALITSSAVVTYFTVSGHWEEAHMAQVRASTKDNSPTNELDV